MLKTAADITGYTYNASNYCPECIYEACIKTMHLADFDLFRSTEEKLDRLAAHRNVDRLDEFSYDSDEFPKVIFREQGGTTCGSCNAAI